MRLSLGTAQFGLDYGVTNPGGQLSSTGAADILKAATANGIDAIDTAAAYGTAEHVLAEHAALLDGMSITTKVPSMRHLCGRDAITALQTHVESSHQKLGSTLECILLHDVGDLLRPEGLSLWAALEEAAASHGIPRIGLSVYEAWEIKHALRLITPDVIQLPYSLFDQRLLHDGTLDALSARGVAAQARSVFLQGLLLCAPSHIPYHLRGLIPAAETLAAASAESGASPLQISLAFLRLTGCIDRAVVGVTSSAELSAICSAAKAAIPAVNYPNFSVLEPSLIDPRHWAQLKQEKRAS